MRRRSGCSIADLGRWRKILRVLSEWYNGEASEGWQFSMSGGNRRVALSMMKMGL